MLIKEIDEELKKRLFDAAFKVRENAYAPYSGFKVGAAILGRSGRIFTGCNVENSSFSGTCCAERVALFKGVSEGEEEFVAIALVVDAEEIGVPCGICRQVLAEFGPDMEVLMANLKGEYRIQSLSKLLPNPFIFHN